MGIEVRKKSPGSFTFQNTRLLREEAGLAGLPWGFGLAPTTRDCKHFSCHTDKATLSFSCQEWWQNRSVQMQVGQEDLAGRVCPACGLSFLALPYPPTASSQGLMALHACADLGALPAGPVGFADKCPVSFLSLRSRVRGAWEPLR